MSEYRLLRDAFGCLVLTLPDGTVHDDVVPVRAFALSATDQGIALVDRRGHELWWIERLASLSIELQTLIREELADRECLPQILAIRAVSSYATPSRWRIDTDRGPTVLTLKSEDDIRRLKPDGLLIADSHGLNFLIRERKRLDRTSQRFLSRFL
ncbi:MAG: DUF1854 domain-containing protein [Betaproteobacteria bacterium HGW-Betaproteobacteria-11]|nr:MAG: DUF1854 domain-containing protein [Betaproteobacteria bacterium HGW-Betaproteobacteria-11]